MGLRGSAATAGQSEALSTRRIEKIATLGGGPLPGRGMDAPSPKDGEIANFLRIIDQRIDEIIAAHERLEARVQPVLSPGPDTGDEPEPPCASNMGATLQGFLRRLTRIYHHTNNLSDRIAL